MSPLEQFDRVLQNGTLQAEESSNGLEVDEHIRKLDGVLREAYSQALSLSRENNDLETSLGIWYKMELFCEKVRRLGRGFVNGDRHLEAGSVAEKAEEMGFACRARWKNIKTELDHLDK